MIYDELPNVHIGNRIIWNCALQSLASVRLILFESNNRDMRNEKGNERMIYTYCIYHEESRRGSAVSIRASLISANESIGMEKLADRNRSSVSFVLYWISSPGPIKHSRNVAFQSSRIVRPGFEATRGAPKVLSRFYIAHDFSVCIRTAFLCRILRPLHPRDAKITSLEYSPTG